MKGRCRGSKMKVLIILVSAILLVLRVKSVPTPSESFSHYTDLVPDDKYHLFWKFDNETITFEAHVKTTGFVGLGISPGGSMKKADIVVGWVKDGATFFHDLYSEGNGQLRRDMKQDWTLVSGKEAGSFTVLKFRRKLVTCDKEDNDITKGTTRLIWSFNDNDPASDSVAALLKLGHGANRGTKSMYLLEKAAVNKALPKDAFYIDFLNSNVTVPTKRTTYWCQAFKPAQLGLTKKHHIVKVEPIIPKAMEGVSHHILLYFCDKKLHDSIHGRSFSCYDRSTYAHPLLGQLMTCNGVTFGWAVGGQATYLPDDVGISIGGPSDPGVYRMETHYDNPTLKSGTDTCNRGVQPALAEAADCSMVDTSGFRIWVTPTPRKYEAGMLQSGMTVSNSQVVPPFYPAFTNYGHCTKECLSDALSTRPQGVTAIGGFLHAHLAGIAITLRHYRNGVELKPIMTDNTYDFNFQDFRILEKPRQILPGDNLVVECTYKSTDRTRITVGGLGTNDEMCLSYLMYYPKIQLTECQSIPTLEQTFQFIGGKIDYTTFTLSEPAKYAGQTFGQVLSSMNWKDIKVRTKFQHGVGNGTVYLDCKKSGGDTWPSHHTVVQTPVIKQHWKVPQTKCPAGKPRTTPSIISVAAKPSGILAMHVIAAIALWYSL